MVPTVECVPTALDSDDEEGRTKEESGNTNHVKLLEGRPRVNLEGLSVFGVGQSETGHGEHTDRDVEPKDPAPSNLGDNDTTQDGAQKESRGESDSNDSAHQGWVVGRTLLKQAGLGKAVQARASDALKSTANDQELHALRACTQSREENENGPAVEKHGSATVNVTALGNSDSAAHVGKEIGEKDKGCVLAVANLLRDNDEGGGDDGRIEGSEEQAHEKTIWSAEFARMLQFPYLKTIKTLSIVGWRRLAAEYSAPRRGAKFATAKPAVSPRDGLG